MRQIAILIGAIAIGGFAGSDAHAQADVFRMAKQCPRIFKTDCPHISYRLAALVRRKGLRCDRVSMVSKHIFGRGFTLRCNDFDYSYNIEDAGGRWRITAN